MDGNSSGSSLRRQADIAKKKAELATIQERKVQAELEALEVKGEAGICKHPSPTSPVGADF